MAIYGNIWQTIHRDDICINLIEYLRYFTHRIFAAEMHWGIEHQPEVPNGNPAVAGWWLVIHPRMFRVGSPQPQLIMSYSDREPVFQNHFSCWWSRIDELVTRWCRHFWTFWLAFFLWMIPFWWTKTAWQISEMSCFHQGIMTDFWIEFEASNQALSMYDTYIYIYKYSIYIYIYI